MRAKEIDIIRSLVIIVLVLYHAMAPFTGGWAAISELSIYGAELYKWLGHFAYAGMLETFVAISGYVYALSESKRQQSLSNIIKGKFKRLLIPALIWGSVYYLLFNMGYSMFGIWEIANGIGHLWFLPMLFGVFILEKGFVERYNIKLWILAIIACLPYPALPFHFNNSLYYLFFFHLGTIVYKNKEKVAKQANLRNLVICIMPACVFLIFKIAVEGETDLSSMPMLTKRIALSGFHTVRLIYSTLIVCSYFIIGFKLQNTNNYQIFKFIAACSFGVYILQEFILRILYYKIDIPHSLLPIAPISCFIIALMGSIVIVAMLRKAKIDRFLF